jgi:hypothetical protein
LYKHTAGNIKKREKLLSKFFSTLKIACYCSNTCLRAAHDLSKPLTGRSLS